ncbi:MAG TPA: DUF5819 family protein [Myxococcales bacterium]|jgi:hypothetical protein|nr:DUF5819 family protein [Myxococcales bacterium]
MLPAILGGILAFHFTVVGLFVTPLNPVKLVLIPYLDAYIRPFFTQRWELFAPDPVVPTRLLLVACRMKNEQGEVEERPWSNMSAPFRAMKEKYRLTPADRIDRAQMSAINMMFEKPDTLVEKLTKTPEDTPEYRKAIEYIELERKARYQTGLRILARVASVECDRLYGQGKSTEVRARLVNIKSPPFSERWSPNSAGETSYVDFEWLPYEKAAPL